MRKLVMTVGIAALALASACGGGGKKNGNGQYGSNLLTDTTVTVAPGQTTAPTAAPQNLPGGGKSTATTRKTTGATLAPGPARNVIADAAKSGDGEFAGLVLGPGPVKKIIYEVMTQSGVDLRPATLTWITGKIHDFSGKPVTVERTPLPDGPTTWDTATIHRYADTYTRFAQGKDGDTAVLHNLVVHGHFPGASGLASRGDVMSVYPDTYSSGSFTTSAATVEKIVVTHETGHNLGLVDLFLNTHRGDYKEDPAPGGHHSPNHRSVMYYTVDTLSVQSLVEGTPTDYDADDQADLRAIAAGAPKGATNRNQRSSVSFGGPRIPPPRQVAAVLYGIGISGLL